MSQAELARRVGEHVTWINNRLRGVADLKADDIPRIARALGVQPADFFEDPIPPLWSRAGEAAGCPDPAEIARVLREDLTGADLELLEGLIHLARRYRRRLAAGDGLAPLPKPPVREADPPKGPTRHM